MKHRSTGVTRRGFLRLGTAGIAGLALFGPGLGHAAEPWQRLDEVQRLLDGATPKRGGILLDLPSISQDGSSISLTVEVESPMTEEDYVEELHLFAAGNPTPRIATVRFTPRAGRARISTRVRLDDSQPVVALARTSDGEWRITHQDVRVTVSGCLQRADTYRSDNLMETRVRLPERFRTGEPGELRTLIQHPMETGLREDGSGEVIPKRIIERFSAHVDGERAVDVDLERSVAANPYFRFFLAPRGPGRVTLEWEEDTGEHVREEHDAEVA